MIEFKIYQTEETIQLVLHELLRRGMHRTEGEPGERSWMENIAKGKTQVEGLTIVCAIECEEMVGLAMCAHENGKIPALLLKHPGHPKSTVKKEMEWSYISMGKFGVFVKEEKRGHGLAKNLLQKMEETRLLELQQLGYFEHPEDRGVFKARMGSVGLIQKYGVFGVVGFDLRSSTNTRSWNHWETTRILFEINEDASTKKPCHQMNFLEKKNSF